MYFDAHCHLMEDNILKTSIEKGVGAIVLNTTKIDEWEKAIAISQKFKECYPCIGIHPWFLDELESEKKKLARERRRRTEKARQLADTSIKQRRIEFEKTQFAQRMKSFYAFCESNKTKLLVSFSIVLTVAVAVAIEEASK